MLVLLSPSKTQDFDTPHPPLPHAPTQPELLEQSAQLMKALRPLKEADLEKLMGISAKLAALNVARNKQWHTPFTPTNARAAIYAFKGDVYDGLDAPSLSSEDVVFASMHVRMLSGLYGLLRPLDLMQPYRLEMGTKLRTPRAKDLYAFWGDTLVQAVNAAAKAAGTDVIVNLASEEYSSAVPSKALHGQWISPQFKEEKGNSLRVLGLFAKRARGMMARYIITTRATTPEALQQFNAGGYRYRADLSTPTQPVFTRPQP